MPSITGVQDTEQNPPTWRQRVRAAWQSLTSGNPLRAVPVGLPDDGVRRPFAAAPGAYNDRAFSTIAEEFRSGLEAWRQNPYARRVINLTTAYVVGDGIAITGKTASVQRWVEQFWSHPENRMQLRQVDWCQELARSGELFVVLFPDANTKMVYARAIPANRIDEIKWRPGDYEAETEFHELSSSIDTPDGAWWKAPLADPEGTGPWMLHYAVNRPVGALRGESDLAAIFKWLRRYSGWLEDRVRLNAALRAFLWIVYAPGRRLAELQAMYRTPPADGAVVIAEEGAERWEAVTPKVQGADAAPDGRAIRWMIAAGSPGLSLVDFGEGEDANLATAQAMRDMRRAFLRQRQDYFGFVLADVVAKAYRLATGRPLTYADLDVDVPDISPEDNVQLAGAVSSLASSFSLMNIALGRSHTFQARMVRWFVKFLGERIDDAEIKQIVEEAKEYALTRAAEENARAYAEDVEQRGANTPRSVE
jgi:hypothetical protein